MENVDCALCGDVESHVVLTTTDRLCGAGEAADGEPGSGSPRPARFTLVRCRSCGLVYLDPRPTADEIGSYYPDDYTVPHAGESLLTRLEAAYRARQQREVVDWLAALGPARGRLLEVGCGAGELLTALRDDSWQACGVEPSARSAAVARDVHSLEVQTCGFEEADLDEGSHDAVVFASVLEHLPDPVDALRRARRPLAPGGLLAVLFLPLFDSPQARLFGRRWLDLDAPRHLYHFEQATFARAVEETGLRVVATRAYSRRHSASLWTASSLPGLQKQRLHVVQRRRPAAAAAGKAAYLTVTTAFRPLARLEALAGLEAQRSYFLKAD